MAIYWDAPVAPDALTTFMRNVPVDTGNRLLGECGMRTVQDNRVDWATINKRNRTARYRAPDGRIHVSYRDDGGRSHVAIPLLSSSLNESEYERLQREFRRVGGSDVSALETAIYNDAQQLTEEVQNRVELAIGDVLTDGVLTIDENGYQGTADFGVPADQIVNAATAWTDTANATVLSDLRAWTLVMRAKGVNPGAVRLGSPEILELMLSNTEVINAVHGSAAGVTYVTIEELNRALAARLVPPVVTDAYNHSVLHEDAETRIVPNDRVFLTPASMGDLIEVVWGTTATALELVDSNHAEMSFGEAAGIVGVVIKEGPPFRQYVFTDASAMPVIMDAQRLFIADVGTIA